MKILVTGGAGFIGKHLIKSLLEKDENVTIFDNFSNSTKKSISSLIKLGVKLVEGDIRQPIDIQNAIKDQNIVIHLAAQISVSKSIKNPLETFEINVDGTRNVLNACEKNGIKKLIVASSAAVYGEGLPNLKLTEESVTDPISPYGESKLKMEQMIKDLVSKHKINCVILRFFNVYGMGQSDEYAGVITKFIEKITQNKSLEIFGDGLQTRDFVSIDDIVNSIQNALSNNKNGIYNIGSGKATTIKEIAEMIISIAGKELDIKYSSPKKGDIRFSVGDISLAKKDLKYKPKFELKEKIKQLL
jgi:UDP-glucose 4-epimerase